MDRHTVRLDPDLMAALEGAVDSGEYPNRSVAVRAAIDAVLVAPDRVSIDDETRSESHLKHGGPAWRNSRNERIGVRLRPEQERVIERVEQRDGWAGEAAVIRAAIREHIHEDELTPPSPVASSLARSAADTRGDD